MKNKWSIIYTDHQKKFIHSNHIKKNNIDSQIILADISNNYNRKFAWKNSDLLIRNWIKNNIDTIQYNNIALIEWDVLINQELPDIRVEGLICKKIVNPKHNRRWPYWKDIHKLKEFSKYAIGTPPFAVLFLDHASIIKWIDKKFDHIYEYNIHNELRLPTLLHSDNVKITTYPMPNVEWYHVNYTNQKSIYHAIKHQVT